MNDREKKRLSYQLTAQAQALENQDGFALGLSAASVGAAMLKTADSSLTVEKLSQGEFETLFAQYLKIGQSVEGFFRTAEQRLRTQAASQPCQELREKLAAGRQKAEALRQDMAQTEQACKEQESENEQLQAKLDAAKKAKKNALDKRASLLNLLGDYSQEILDKQLAENAKLTERFNTASSELHGLQEQHKELLEKLSQAESGIEAQPEENRLLLERCEEKRALLKQLENAQIDCGPEKQAELEKQIQELSPIVEENQQAVQTLSDRLEDLKKQNVTYDSKRQTLNSNVLELVQSALDTLNATLTEHEDRLNQVRAQADRLTERMAACEENRRLCQGWLDADMTPLEAMIAALDRPEAQELRKTLDLGALETVRRLRTETEDRLRQLDTILSACAKAAQMDRSELEKRARR